MVASNTGETENSDREENIESKFDKNGSRRQFLATTSGLALGASALGTSGLGRGTASKSPKSIPDEWETNRISSATGYGGAAASLDPRGTQAAIDILKRGGNAVDAAVAASAMLGVVTPFMTGIGGDAETTIYLAEEDEIVTINSRSIAPKKFDAEEFQDLPLSDRFTGPVTTGVPGLVRGWETMVDNYGSKPLHQLLQPAITTAQSSFEVDPMYASRVESNVDDFKCFLSSRDLYLTEDNEAPSVGDRIRNRDLAETYRTIAQKGADAFYEGEIAEAIVETVNDPPVAPGCDTLAGDMNLKDLSEYESPVHDPVTVSYRDYDVAGIGMPSTGASTVGEILKIIEGFEFEGSREHALHYMLEASRMAFTDRAEYIGHPWDWDPSVPVSEYPVAELISETYAAERRSLIDETANQDPYPPGDPTSIQNTGTNPVETPKLSTHHLSVSDSDGNIVSHTSSIISIGGSAVAVPDHGFLLNNVLIGAIPPAAPEERGGRPYSNGSPTIVFEDGEPILTVGSPGSFSIITTVANILVNYLDLGMDLEAAMAAPRLENTSADVSASAESDFFDTTTADGLAERGHDISDDSIIGQPTGLEFLADGRVRAVSEPSYPEEGSAMVEKESQRRK